MFPLYLFLIVIYLKQNIGLLVVMSMILRLVIPVFQAISIPRVSRLHRVDHAFINTVHFLSLNSELFDLPLDAWNGENITLSNEILSSHIRLA